MTNNIGNKEIMSSNLKRLMNERNLSQAELSRRLGFKTSTLGDWISGKSYPRIDKIEKMANYFNVEKSALIEPYKSQNNFYHEVIQIPLIGEIACGEPITAIENVETYMPAPAFTTPSGNNFYLRAKGDSMKPTINDKSLVLIHEQPAVEDGEIAAVLIDGDATLKRVKHQGKTVILMPDNNQYNPIVLTDDIEARILGKAVQVVNNL